MNKVKQFLSSKGIGFYISMVACVFAIVSLITYCVVGKDIYGFNPLIVVMLVLGILVNVVSGYKNFFNAGSILTTIFYALALGLFVKGRLLYYVTLLFNIAQDGASSAMNLATITFVVMLVISVCSSFFRFEKEVKVK